LEVIGKGEKNPKYEERKTDNSHGKDIAASVLPEIVGRLSEEVF